MCLYWFFIPIASNFVLFFLGVRISASHAKGQRLPKEQNQSNWILWLVSIIFKILQCIVIVWIIFILQFSKKKVKWMSSFPMDFPYTAFRNKICLVEARKRSITKSEFCHYTLVLIWQQTQTERSYSFLQ